jgi:hypothetical protein
VTDALRALLGWLAVVELPGLLLALSLRRDSSLGHDLAVAPVLGLGLNIACAHVLQWSGVEVRLATVLPVAAAVVVLVALTGIRSNLRRPSVRLVPRSLDAWLLVAAVVCGTSIWLAGSHLGADVLPSADGAHHALWVSRISRLHTIDPHVLLAGDVASGSPTSAYYPFGLHLSASLAAQLTGASANASLSVATVLAAAVLLPAGMYLLSRRLIAGRPGVPGVTAVIAATFPWFPYEPMHPGAVTMVVGLSVVPIVVDTAWPTAGCRSWPRYAFMLALCAYGLFELHNSEVVAAGLFVIVLVISSWRCLDTAARARLVRAYAAAFGLLVLSIVPELVTLRAGASERSGVLGDPGPALGGAVKVFFQAANPWVLVPATIGVVVAVRRRLARAWLAAGVLFLGLLAAALSRTAVGTALTYPWYASALRVSYNITLVEAVFAAVGVVAVAAAVARRWPVARRGSFVARGVAAFVAAGTFAPLLPAYSAVSLNLAYENSSTIGDAQRAGFRWLAAHVHPGDRVLNDFDDGSAWMSTLADVTPVFATYPTIVSADDAASEWGDRWYLLTHAASLAVDGKAQHVARAWHVTYVYYSAHVIVGLRHWLDRRALERSAAYRLAWHTGSVWIFRVDLAAAQAVGGRSASVPVAGPTRQLGPAISGPR